MPTTDQPETRLLTINTGSSSLKAAIYAMGRDPVRELSLVAERIGGTGGHMTITDASGTNLLDERRDLPDHAAALHLLFGWLHEHRDQRAFGAVGHRIVHGGVRFREPARITPDLLSALADLTAIDPEHLPQALAAIRTVRDASPDTPQVACFDTAFHARMPPVARDYAFPPEYAAMGIIRYGFHGLSYEYIMQALRAEDAAAVDGRVVIAHLGNGASIVAVRGGVGIDTTMGFSPTGGLVMGTRTGDLDPSVPLYLVQSRGMSPADVTTLVNKRAGMLGVSGTSGDMRDLLEREATDARAAAAVDLFCYTAKKYVGALAASLGGLDTLIFTGGIGEHAAPVRARICAGLEFLGIAIDPARNAAHARIVSPDGGRVTVRVLPTDEDVMVARHTYDVLTDGGTRGLSL